MNFRNYEYHGHLTAQWDLLRSGITNWPETPFYLDLIHEYGQPVLDVGCGTGRLLLDYFSQGFDVVGLDNSPEMVALCREKAKKIGTRARHLHASDGNDGSAAEISDDHSNFQFLPVGH